VIIHVVTQEEAGGAQLLALRLCRAHRAAGVAAETWFLYRKSDAVPGEPGVRRFAQTRPSPLAIPGLLARLVAELRTVRPTAVLAHTHWANLLVPLAARCAGIRRRVAVLHSPVVDLPLASAWAELAAARIDPGAVRVAIAPAVARAWPGRPPLVIANGLPPALPGDGARLRAGLGLASGTPVVAAVGRLASEKGHADLVAALAVLPGVHAAIAGTGSCADALRAAAGRIGVADRLHLLGALPPAGVADLLAAADAFAMPSRFEGLSLALLEAMRAGLPVVASAVPGNRDALGHEDPAGLLVPPGDVAALAAALQRVLSDRGEAHRLGAAAVRRAADFGEDAMVAAWHRLLGVA
jgi:glycosyltransferase involved in cell wall biosynthesis